MKYLSLLVVSALLSACGFHLRGSVDLPLSATPIQLISETADAVQKALSERLQQTGIQVVDSLAACRKQASDEQDCVPRTVVYLRHNSVTQRNLNIASSAQQRMINVEVKQTLEIEVRDGHGAVLIAPRYISLRRELFYDERAPLALTVEMERVQRELQEDVLGVITRLLRVVLKN